MKLTIIKKTVKEGVSYAGKPYSIKTLFCKFEEKKYYDQLVAHLLSNAVGATQDQVDKFVKPDEYEGVVSYALWLNCSSFTFDRVVKWGKLKCKLDFVISKNGYLNSKIKVEGGKEVIYNYYPPSDESNDDVDGWTGGNEPDVVKHEEVQDLTANNDWQAGQAGLGTPSQMPTPTPTGEEAEFVDDLPF